MTQHGTGNPVSKSNSPPILAAPPFTSDGCPSFEQKSGNRRRIGRSILGSANLSLTPSSQYASSKEIKIWPSTSTSQSSGDAPNTTLEIGLSLRVAAISCRIAGAPGPSKVTLENGICVFSSGLTFGLGSTGIPNSPSRSSGTLTPKTGTCFRPKSYSSMCSTRSRYRTYSVFHCCIDVTLES